MKNGMKEQQHIRKYIQQQKPKEIMKIKEKMQEESQQLKKMMLE